ncbi:S1 family peptidase [Clavibacter michiganensis]|uniref:S1 family peptidase n=1 Tax=Clavibacter michiganensis TaxID=28447 RepID=UPI001BE0F8A8|nr:S1 family peptidase [Clavibacter michiganensis]MBT1636307.1 trypsin-like serine protease [Clavibacter michiganensis]
MLANLIGAGLAVAMGMSAGSAPATAWDEGPARSQIIAGHVAPRTPWVVQLEEIGGTIPAGYEDDCTGVQVDASWVLTARHCAEETDDIDVYQSNSVTHQGSAAHADRVVIAPEGDIALVHLAAPAPLSGYASLDLRSGPATSGTGTIEGYGSRAHSTDATRLYAATVRLRGHHDDAFGGAGQEATGVDGAANDGDSGGPLLVQGRVRGIASLTLGDTGDDPHAGSVYALLSQDAAWIRSTTGVHGAGRSGR